MRKKEFATECHRCIYNGQGSDACLECLRRRPGNAFGQPSKRGKTIVSYDALVATDDASGKPGRIKRDDLHAVHADWTRRPRYDLDRLWDYVADELAGLVPGGKPEVMRLVFEQDSVPDSLEALADQLGLRYSVVKAAGLKARAKFEAELSEEDTGY